MIERILVAVDDSADGLAAARTGIALARSLDARLRFVHVTADGAVTAAIGTNTHLAERREQAGTALLRHVEGLATDAGVPADTRLLIGQPSGCILDEAHAWPAGLVIIGRSDRRGPGQPYMGRETRHVLEFAEQPVLVVPRLVPGDAS
jgi:nucleotide-binding universal stress UspA family protein